MKISFKIVTFLVALMVLGFTFNLTVVEAAMATPIALHVCGPVSCTGTVISVTPAANGSYVGRGSGTCSSSDSSCSGTCNQLDCIILPTDLNNFTGYGTCTCYGANFTVRVNGNMACSNAGSCSLTGGNGSSTLCGNGACEGDGENTGTCPLDCPSVSGDTGPSSTRSLSTSTGSGFTVTTPAYGTASSLSIEGLIGKALDVLWLVFVGFAIFMFIIAGMQFFLAQGDPGKVDTARQFVLWGVIGMAMGVLAFTLPFVVGGWLGLS